MQFIILQRAGLRARGLHAKLETFAVYVAAVQPAAGRSQDNNVIHTTGTAVHTNAATLIYLGNPGF